MVYASIGLVMGNSGGGGGTSNYNGLTNKPKIGGVTLQGDKTPDNLNLLDKNSTQTVTGKNIDAEDNTILNLILSNFKSGVIKASISPTPSDSNLLTEKGTNDLVKVAAHKMNLSMSTDYIMTLQLLDKENNVIDTKTVNLPLESMVVGGSYDSTNKKITLTLQGGSTIDIPVADLINGLVSDNRKIGSHDLKADITAQNLYDDIKDKIEHYKLVSTFEGETGNTKTLYILDTTYGTYEKGLYIYNGTKFVPQSSTGFQYKSMPTPSADNLGKIVQYTGVTTTTNPVYTHGYFYECSLNAGTYYWKNIEIQPVSVPTDLASQVSGNTYNSTNLTFNTNRFKCMNGLGFIKQDIDLKTAVTDYSSNSIKLMELPAMPTGYEYPDKIYITIVKPAGQMTCMENKNEFFVAGGAHYINPNVGVGVEFLCKSYTKVEDAHDSSGNAILIAEQIHHTQTGAAIIDENGVPSCKFTNETIKQGATDNPKIYILNKVVGTGYQYVKEYYKTDGTKVTGDFYEIIENDATIDTTYLYKCYLADQLKSICQGFVVNEEGKIGSYKIEQSAASELCLAIEKTGARVKFQHGYSGTVTFVPKTQVKAYSMVEATIESQVLKISGGNTLESFHFGEVL